MDFYIPEEDAGASDEAAASVAELPDVLLIGDSISCGYTEPTRELLKDVCNLQRAPDNCGDTKRGLEKLDEWLGGRDWDLIHFNWGLHDICYRHPDSKVYGNRDKIKGTLAVTPDQYRENLDILVQKLQKRARKLVWASTTYVPDDEVGRFQDDEIRYNMIAAEIMAKYDIPINDLHALTASFPPDLFTCPGDVHFSPAGTARIAAAVAACIRTHLQQPKA